MAESFIDIKEDASPTKKLASQTHSHGVDTVHAEEIVIVDSAGNLVNVTASRLLVDGSGVIQPVSDGGGALTVDALDLDIRNLVPAQDEVKVSGTAADGAAVSGNPVRIAGKDGGGLTQDIATDAAGELQIDVLSSALPTGAATAANQLPDGHNVTVDNAAGASAVNIQDGGNIITVDGTVSISGTVTVADASLDNTTLVDNNAFTDSTTRVGMSGYIFDETAGTALTENDAAAARIDSKRAQVLVLEDETTRGRRLAITADKAALIEGRRGQTLLFASVSVATSGDNQIVAADVSNKIKVLSYVLVADAAISVKWRSGTTDLTGAMAFAAGGGVAIGGGNSPTTHWEIETAVNQALNLNLSASTGVRGHICYFKEP